jgi:protoheme ferro-lyase
MILTHDGGSKMATGLLIVNLGSPVSPSTRDVRRYLQEFLSDQNVITMPKMFISMNGPKPGHR